MDSGNAIRNELLKIWADHLRDRAAFESLPIRCRIAFPKRARIGNLGVRPIAAFVSVQSAEGWMSIMPPGMVAAT